MSTTNSTQTFVSKAIHFVQSLILPFIRPIDTGSFGRIVCTFLLAISYYYSWRLSKDIPPTLLTVLEAMLLYVFGSKVYTGYTSIKRAQMSGVAAVNAVATESNASDDAASK